MTTLGQNQSQNFQELLEQHFRVSAKDGGLLQKPREKAWDHFLALGLPTKRTEVYQYVRLKDLFSQSYILSKPSDLSHADIASYIYPECTDSLIVFVNGHYQPGLSKTQGLPKRLVVANLNDAARTYGAFLNNQWAKTIQEETDPFAILNAALSRDGAFIYLPPKSVVETPMQVLQIVHGSDGSNGNNGHMLMQPRLQVFVGSQSEVSIISSLATIPGSGSSNGFCFNYAADLTIEEDAHVKYTQISCDVPKDAWILDAVRARLKRNSTLKAVNVTTGSATVRNDFHVILTGENAEASLNGIWMLSDKCEAHTNVLMDHQAPNCRSMQLFKGVLDDFSRSSFEGKIHVRQIAQKTEAYQLNNNLLLSDRANADSKPNLEIFADDVKASHGATVGQLDQEQLFYMKCRGFAEKDAKKMLVRSFCKEVLDLLPIQSIQVLTATNAN